MAAKPVPENIQRAAKAAFTFLSKFSSSRWPIFIGRKPSVVFGDRGFPAVGSRDALQWLEANIRNKSGMSVCVKGLHFSSHLCISTHKDNMRAFPARAMGLVQAGISISLLWRLCNEVDLKRAEELAKMAIPVIGGRYHEDFLFPLPGSMSRCGVAYEPKRMDPSIISWPTQFMAATPKAAEPAAPLDPKASSLLSALHGFGINASIAGARKGPSVTFFEVLPPKGTKASSIISLSDDLASAMGVAAVRVDPTTGSATVGIEVPNDTRETVSLAGIMTSTEYRRSSAVLPMILGKAIDGTPVIADLKKMPHLLIAGTTGSGKSVGLKTMLLSMMARRSPAELGFLMIDPKELDLAAFNASPHLVMPVITDPAHAIEALARVTQEMDTRYSIIARREVDNIGEFNEVVRLSERLPDFVVVIDELQDLMEMAGDAVNSAMRRLSSKARAAGIHLIMATQRPDVSVLSGTIRANMPERISFRVLSAIDARIIGVPGAEHLLGEGDMLYMAAGARPQRIQGAFASSREIREMVARLADMPSPAKRVGADWDALPLPRAHQKQLAASNVTTKIEKIETAAERIERSLKFGGLPTSKLCSDANVSRMTLNRMKHSGFLVAQERGDGRDTVWTLAR